MNPSNAGRWFVIGAALLTGLLAVTLVSRAKSNFAPPKGAVHAETEDKTQRNRTKKFGQPADGGATTPVPPREAGTSAIKPPLANLDHTKNPFFSPALAAVRLRQRQAADQARIEAEARKQAEEKAMREAAAKAEEAERARLAKEKTDAEAAKKQAEKDKHLAAEKAKEDARLAAEKAAAEAAAEAAAIPPPKVVVLRYQGMFAAGGKVGALIAVDDEPAAYRSRGDLVGAFRLDQITRESVDLLSTNGPVRRLSVPAGESRSFRENGAPHEE